MPRLSQHQESHLYRTIRDAIALDPLMTIPQLQKVLEQKTKRLFDKDYISKLLKKVSRGLTADIDRTKIAPRLVEIKEKHRLAYESLLKIAYDQVEMGQDRPSASDRINAWRTIAIIEKMSLDAEIELGIFNADTSKVNDGEVTIRYRPLPHERVQLVANAMRLWGAAPPPMRKIEAKEVIIPSTSNGTTNITIQAPAAPSAPSSTPIRPVIAPPAAPGGFALGQ